MSISKKRLKEIEAIKDKDIDYSDIFLERNCSHSVFMNLIVLQDQGTRPVRLH